MGSQLVRLALVPRTYLDLTPAARLCLVKMAEVAHDRGDPPIYWGGWVLLSQTLGYPEYTPGAHSAVKRACRQLVDAKLVTVQSRPADGIRARYALNLTLWDP